MVNGALHDSSFVGTAALFVLLEAYFIAVLQVLVYAGAVMVLFLFIIMLLNVEKGEGGGYAKDRFLWLPRLLICSGCSARSRRFWQWRARCPSRAGSRPEPFRRKWWF